MGRRLRGWDPHLDKQVGDRGRATSSRERRSPTPATPTGPCSCDESVPSTPRGASTCASTCVATTAAGRSRTFAVATATGSCVARTSSHVGGARRTHRSDTSPATAGLSCNSTSRRATSVISSWSSRHLARAAGSQSLRTQMPAGARRRGRGRNGAPDRADHRRARRQAVLRGAAGHDRAGRVARSPRRRPRSPSAPRRTGTTTIATCGCATPATSDGLAHRCQAARRCSTMRSAGSASGS